jgi:hypothetical protein
MPRSGYCRPKDNGKKPDKDADQGNWVRNNFDQLTPSRKKNRSCSQSDWKRKFSSKRASQRGDAFRLAISLCLHRHAREHIEAALQMQSPR